MALPAHVRATACALVSLLCLPSRVLAQEDDSFSHACGLESPDAVYVPLPGPRPHETRWRSSEPPLVRREDPPGGVSALSGLPQTRVRTGALSGKTIYLSPGHGFYRSAPLGRWATQRGNTNDVVEDLVSLETLDQYLMPMLMGAGATVIPVRESDLNPHMAIVDNGREGYSEEGAAELFSTASPNSGWGPPPSPMGNAVRPFQLGDHRVLTAASTATARATWAPSIPADGYYHVYVSYGADPGRVTDAHYMVRHAGGESHFRVNQRRHGGTWLMLGRFYFRAGQHPETASVVALNDSAEAGSISLDAVRFGGGSGAIGDAALGALPRARAEECARYHTQFSGAPPDVFAPSGTNALSNERNDDVSARPRFASWLHEEGEDAIYVAWHTNASSNGTVRGTEAYVYGPNPVDGTYNFTGVPGSEVLAQSLLDELKADLQREVEPAWRVRNLRSANLGEVNPRHNPEFPSVLMEVAYHDNALDAARLKEPAFRRIAARAFLQGIIKYFAVRDGVAVQLPPEAPPALVARNAGSGKVEVKWVVPPDPDGNVPAKFPATGYRLYQSADGLAWDEGTETDSTTFSLSLSPRATRYFRVAAFNAGGESFPSDVVGVRVPEAGGSAQVLVVNAFRRLDSSLARAENLSVYDLGSPLRALLESMNDGTALRRHGDAVSQLGVAFDGATSEALSAGLFTPVGYRVLDWFTGRGGVGGAGPDAAEQALMRTFVAGGGHLLLSGSHVASALAAGGPADQSFLTEFLRALPGCSASALLVNGLSDRWFPGLAGSLLDDGLRGSYPVGVPDALIPLEGGAPVLGYAGTGSAAGVASTAGGHVLFLGMPFEGLVSPARRTYLMGTFLARAGVLASAPTPPEGEELLPPGAPATLVGSGAPCSLDRIPDSYVNAETGCGCRASGGTASISSLLLLLIVHLRRAHRRSGFTER
ncbi:N-acetylmuramoyl-L-alanine amidase [Archangium violaceum]|uniref:golvesin C-terminal-like domain-containing protein n=1 Tax=Archangium violaceum TaxID=83451 RepID=UPI00195153A5|nr:N-acetylmuramoyl-L-alanine amidase [Archangium violaceum]QRN94071.1 N-acetylmuramoyl-L-alanine amidase [Archangium violaceum]